MANEEPRVRVRLPRSLLQYWNGPASVDVSGRNLSEVFAALEREVEGLSSRILDDQGRIRRHVLVFLNDVQVERGELVDVAVRGGDRVHIVPSVSGG